ncbi:hypothetical protein WJX77_007990 [Trebouxia sp. C0004]
MSGSIFRRGGQKTEAHGTPSEQQFSGAHLETKLAALQKSWSAPLTAATQSLAVWRPEHDGAEVTIERGNVLQRMGYRHHRKLYLHVEEAVYLVSKGNLLLSLFDPAGQQNLSSLQEATELMVSTGVSIAQYQVYCHLVQAGYIVTRHPAMWVLDDMKIPSQIWGEGSAIQQHSVLPNEQAVPSSAPLAELDTQEPSWCISSHTSLPPPSKRFKQSEQAEMKLFRKWWPAAPQSNTWNPGATDMQADLPRCEVVAEEASGKEAVLLAKLKPFPAICFEGTWGGVTVPSDLKLVYDVLKPNKQFSKGKPDAPKLAVCLSTGSNLPSCSIVQHLLTVVAPLPLQFARVSGGEVSFHSLQSLH